MESQDRLCLRCQKRFPSTGPGNRICGRCAVQNRRGHVYVPVETPKEEGENAPSRQNGA